MSNRIDDLEAGREAYTSRAWLEAHDRLSKAHRLEPLDAPDLELVAIAAVMLGRDDDCVAWLEAAHQRHLEDGETIRAVYCAA